MLRSGLVSAIGFAVVLASTPAAAFERARPIGLYPPGAAPALAMLDSRIDVTVRGPILETVVVQRFRNTTGHATEATYIFPLPPDAAVSAMRIQLGARTIHAVIDRREAAQRAYEAAVTAGVGAALLEQERPDVFTQTVAAIPPGGVVEVVVRYDSAARFEAGTWQLVVPMVVAPRYVPGTASGRATTGTGRAPDTDRAPDASRVTPAAAPGAGGATAVTIHFVDEPAELSCPTHELAGTRRDASFADPHSDHDAIVRWRTAAPSAGWVERDGDAGYAAVVVEAAPAVARPAPVRVVLALDRAATTRGDGDAVERPLVRALLGALEHQGHGRVRVIGSDPVAWSAPSDALAQLERTWGRAAAVFDTTRVLAGARPEGAAIVLISDGLIADDAAAIAAARALGVAVHVIGIGPAPARAALTQLAAVTGGTARFAGVGDDLGALARGVVADLASPPAPLAINWGTLGASEVEPAALPRLGAGQAMLVVARIKHAQAANARTRGEVFAFEALAPARPVDGATTAHGALARRWARDRLGDLLVGPHDREAVTRLALGYGLVSPYTSLVAIGSDVVVQGGVKHSVAVPVSLPSGMQWQAVQQAHELDTRDPLADARPERPPVAGARPPTTPAPVTSVPADRAKKAKRPPATDEDGDADDDARPANHSAADRDARAAGAAESSPALTDEELAKLAEQEAKTEVITITGSVIDRKTLLSPAPTSVFERGALEAGRAGRAGRAVRLAASLGGGLAIDHGARGLVALDVRLETVQPTRLGGEAALWLVGGDDAQGRVLLTVARAVSRHLDLGFGAGLHFGAGTGPAGAVRLGVVTPLPWLAGFLRYDAAVLITRPSVAAEHAVLLGLELSY